MHSPELLLWSLPCWLLCLLHTRGLWAGNTQAGFDKSGKGHVLMRLQGTTLPPLSADSFPGVTWSH